jgi:hypothetical protein
MGHIVAEVCDLDNGPLVTMVGTEHVQHVKRLTGVKCMPSSQAYKGSLISTALSYIASSFARPRAYPDYWHSNRDIRITFEYLLLDLPFHLH